MTAEIGRNSFIHRVWHGGGSGSEVGLAFDAACNTSAILGRLDSLPPVGLIDAPPPRREAVTRNPEMLRKLAI